MSSCPNTSRAARFGWPAHQYLEDVPPDLYQFDKLVDAFSRLATLEKNGNPRMLADNKTPMTLNTLPPFIAKSLWR